MTAQISLLILVICSTATSLTTEAVKAFLGEDRKIADNLLVLYVAIVVGCVITLLFYKILNVPFTTFSIAYIPLMCVCNWIGAMVGYDKVLQLIEQFDKIQV